MRSFEFSTPIASPDWVEVRCGVDRIHRGKASAFSFGQPRQCAMTAAVPLLMPNAVRVQLVSPTKALPVRPGWLHEPKIDGVRLLLGKSGGAVQARTRGGHLVQSALPELVDALQRLPVKHVVLDAELVALDEHGRTDFDATCARLRGLRGPPVTAFVFDLLALDGEDLRERTLRERKAVLRRVLGRGSGALIPMHVFEGSAAALVDAVNELELEGVVSKWSGSRYVGGRSSLWRKLVLRRPEKGWRVEVSVGRRHRAGYRG